LRSTRCRADKPLPSFGLTVVGKVGILRDAVRKGLIDLPQTIARLRETRFRIAERILEDVLSEWKARSGE
jgi:predicted nucleic acid-binding protein